MILCDLYWWKYELNGFSFQFLTMFYAIVGAGAVGAWAASRYGYGSDQKMQLRLRLRNTDFFILC
jgi:hypothetical protein